MASADTPKCTLGYWHIRGYAQPLRFLLTYLDVPFLDKTYEYGPAPDFSREEWLKDKSGMASDLSFPNLPYLLDGDFKITQSLAILRYIATEYGPGSGLYDGTPKERARIDMLLEQAVDLRNAAARAAYGNAFDSLFSSAAPEHLGLWQRFFAAQGATAAWAAGEKLSIADFVLCEALQHISIMASEKLPPGSADILAAYPAVSAYLQRFFALPAVAKYVADPSYLSRPFNGATAAWR